MNAIIVTRRRMHRIAVVSLLIAGGLVLIPRAAIAATANTHRFSESTTFVSPTLSICVDVNVSGGFTYSATRTVTVRGPHFSLTSITLIDPVLSAEVHVWTFDAGCTGARADVSQMTLRQLWHSGGAAPSQPLYDTTYGSGTTFTQNNTGAPTIFADRGSISGAPTACYRVAIVAEYQGETSSAAADDFGASTKQVCLTPAY